MTDSPIPDRLSALTDEELWSAFVYGQDAAVTALAERYEAELNWYLVLSAGKQDKAARHQRDVWAFLAAYRRPFEGFASFCSWLYAAATQNAVPATHPEMFGLGDLLDDIKRGEAEGRRAKLFFTIADMTKAVRQPFLLVTMAGLPVEEAAKACNFTVEKTLWSVESAYRQLERSGLFDDGGGGDEV